MILASDSSESEVEDISIDDVQVLQPQDNGEYSEYGIGARLLQQMGFVPGRGLGAKEDGRRDIVETIGREGKQGLGVGIIPIQEAFEVAEDETSDSETRELELIVQKIQACKAVKKELQKDIGDIDLEDIYARYGQYWSSMPIEDLAIVVQSERLRRGASLEDIYELRFLSDSDSVKKMLKAIWIPEVKRKCLEWSDATSRWLLELTIRIETKMPEFSWLLAEIELIVAQTVPQQDVVQYIDEWWPVDARAEQVAATECSAILRRELTPHHEAARYDVLKRWRELNDELASAIDALDDQFDGTEIWRKVYGPEFATKRMLWQGQRLIQLAKDRDGSLPNEYSKWADGLELENATEVLDALNLVFDGSSVAEQDEPHHVVSTFKDVVEYECERIGAVLARKDGVEAIYQILRGQKSIECRFEDDVFYYKKNGRFMPISITKLPSIV